MGFVDKWPSRMQGEWYFRSRADKSFQLGPEYFHFSLGSCPCLNLPPQKVRGGGGGRGLASPGTNMRGMCEVYPRCGDIICPLYRQALIIHICANVPSRHSHSSCLQACRGRWIRDGAAPWKKGQDLTVNCCPPHLPLEKPLSLNF